MSSTYLQIRSKSIVAYYKRDKERRSGKISAARQLSIDQLQEHETYTGLVTHGSQKRLTRALENLLQVSQPKEFVHHGRNCVFKVNFVTLTLYSFSRKVPGKEAHKNCLEPLLRWLRGQGMSAYVWKAELQSKRMDCHQLHYHLTTDIYIDKYKLRDKWNQLQREAGYLNYFFEKFGHWSPNSTDIHATHNKKNLIGYLKKKIVRYADKKQYQKLKQQYLIRAEMAKADQNQETIEGKVWDCSLNLKVAFYEMAAYANVTRKLADAVILGDMRKTELERCTVYEIVKPWRNPEFYMSFHDKLFYNEHLKRMRCNTS